MEIFIGINKQYLSMVPIRLINWKVSFLKICKVMSDKIVIYENDSGNHLMGQRQPSGTPFKNSFKSVGNV